MPKVIFDFDGTIADGQQVLVEVLNSLASEFGYKIITPDQIQEFKNMGARDFILKHLRVPFWKIHKLEKRGREEYRKHITNIRLFDGIGNIIKLIREKGIEVGIISSNTESTIKEILERNNVIVDFIYSGSSIFGKHRVIKRMLKDYNIDPKDVIYIGDEVRDVESCRKIGIKVISITWGYNSKEALEKAKPDFLIDTPAELVNIVDKFRYP